MLCSGHVLGDEELCAWAPDFSLLPCPLSSHSWALFPSPPQSSRAVAGISCYFSFQSQGPFCSPSEDHFSNKRFAKDLCSLSHLTHPIISGLAVSQDKLTALGAPSHTSLICGSLFLLAVVDNGGNPLGGGAESHISRSLLEFLGCACVHACMRVSEAPPACCRPSSSVSSFCFLFGLFSLLSLPAGITDVRW